MISIILKLLYRPRTRVVYKPRFWAEQKNQSGVTNYPPPQALGARASANEVISVRPNKGTAEQRDGRTKGRPNKGTAEQRDGRTKRRSTGVGANYPTPHVGHHGRVKVITCKIKVIKCTVRVIVGRINEVIKVRSLRSGH